MKSLQQFMGGKAGRLCVGALAFLLANFPALPASGISLTGTQRAKLTVLVESDSEAAKQFRNLRRKADAAANEAGNPTATIQVAGRLASDPLRKESIASLEDMKRLVALGYASALSTNAAYTAAARRIILRWAEVNQPSGQPIDETKLDALFIAYDLTRSTFAAEESAKVEKWLRRIADAELQGVRTNSVTATNNWQSHRLKTVGLIALLLEDRALIDQTVRGFKRQVADNLRPDGSSFDFHHRDSLHYHCYTLEPLLALAVALQQNGIELFNYQAPSGASLSNSVSFLVPFCDGRKVHREFVRTQSRFDRVRTDAGEPAFAPGKTFDPREARHVFDLASFFDEQFKPLALRLNGGGAGRFPTWQSVLNKVRK